MWGVDGGWGAGRWGLEAGGWGLGLGAGGWRLGAGGWGLGLGLEAGGWGWGLEAGGWGLGAGGWRLGLGDCDRTWELVARVGVAGAVEGVDTVRGAKTPRGRDNQIEWLTEAVSRWNIYYRQACHTTRDQR